MIVQKTSVFLAGRDAVFQNAFGLTPWIAVTCRKMSTRNVQTDSLIFAGIDHGLLRFLL